VEDGTHVVQQGVRPRDRSQDQSLWSRAAATGASAIEVLARNPRLISHALSAILHTGL
jgi:hypothetical protein